MVVVTCDFSSSLVLLTQYYLYMYQEQKKYLGMNMIFFLFHIKDKRYITPHQPPIILDAKLC
jgi:hypothetical protein